MYNKNEKSFELIDKKITKTIFISDIHAPYQDDRALEALYDFISKFKPDEIIYIGDVVDFYGISRFVSDPDRAMTINEEIDQAKGILDIINRLSPRSKKFFVKGNHEARLQKYLWTKARELSRLDVLTLDHLLGFRQRKIEYIESGMFKYRGIVVKHGNVVRKFSGYTAKAELEKLGISGVSGHTHRAGLYHYSNMSGDYSWMEIGCLCKLDAEYLEGDVPNWQQGFGIGFFRRDGQYDLNFVPIKNGVARFAGIDYE